MVLSITNDSMHLPDYTQWLLRWIMEQQMQLIKLHVFDVVMPCLLWRFVEQRTGWGWNVALFWNTLHVGTLLKCVCYFCLEQFCFTQITCFFRQGKKNINSAIKKVKCMDRINYDMGIFGLTVITAMYPFYTLLVMLNEGCINIRWAPLN